MLLLAGGESGRAEAAHTSVWVQLLVSACAHVELSGAGRCVWHCRGVCYSHIPAGCKQCHVPTWTAT